MTPSRRRVTRSQSKEVENGLASGLRRGARGSRASVTHQNAASSGSKSGLKEQGKVKESDSITVVIEESPAKSPQKPARSGVRQLNSSSPGLGDEDGEDPHNMSGTTILPTDSEPETGDPDPVMAMDVLEALQHAATGILDALMPRALEPDEITNMAKRLRDPKDSLKRRLTRFLTNLKKEAEYFTKQTYIDVDAVKKALPSTLTVADGKPWTPDLIVHLVNCSRLAADALLATESTSMRQVIDSLEGTFPAPFLNGLVARGNASAGMSSLRKPTFNAAVDIRTQYFRLKLEERQFDPKLDPQSILRGVFHDEQLLDDEAGADSGHADTRPLRGFGLSPFQDENGRLPEEWQEDVLDRIDHISSVFTQEHGGHAGVARVNMAFSWQEFTHRLISWVRRRYDEILAHMKTQSNLDDVRSVLENRPDETESVVKETQRSPENIVRASQTPGRRVVTGDTTAARPVEPNKPDAVRTSEHDVAERSKRQDDAKTKSSTRRKSSKRWDSAELERLSARWNAANRPIGERDRRQSDPPVGRRSERASSPRRETLSALPPSSLQQVVEPSEIPESPEPSDRSRVIDSDDGGDVVGDSQWEAGDETVQTAVDAAGPSQGLDGSTLAPSFASHSSRSRPPAVEAPNMASNEEIFGLDAQKTVGSPSAGTRTKTPTSRHFIDRQANARRTSPISEGLSTERRSTAPRAAPAPTPTGRKRPHPESSGDEDADWVDESEEEDDDDNTSDAFATDDRAIILGDKRKQKPVQKRRRQGSDDESPAEDAAEFQLLVEHNMSQQAAGASGKPNRRLDIIGGRLREPTARSRSPEPVVRRRREESVDSQVGRRRLRKRFKQQHRKRWTLEEEKRLIKLIERYGCSWATLKEKDHGTSAERGGPKLEDRDQVALKDKARNIKLDYLRRAEKPHDNFKFVTIGKREEQQYEDVLRKWGWR